MFSVGPGRLRTGILGFKGFHCCGPKTCKNMCILYYAALGPFGAQNGLLRLAQVLPVRSKGLFEPASVPPMRSKTLLEPASVPQVCSEKAV